VAGAFLERTRHVFEDLPTRGNWFVHYILTGEYDADERLLPPYLLEENHPRLRAALDRVTIVNDALEDYLPCVEANRFSKFYLSDVFEYVPEDAAERLLREIWRVGRPGGVLSYRNLLAPRSRPSSMATMLEPDEHLARRCNLEDRSFVYTRHVVERIRKAASARAAG
jgi:S-adenosylmethionine-diacylglycerol 3-amino-3-carboxypropyl transferase